MVNEFIIVVETALRDYKDRRGVATNQMAFAFSISWFHSFLEYDILKIN